MKKLIIIVLGILFFMTQAFTGPEVSNKENKQKEMM